MVFLSKKFRSDLLLRPNFGSVKVELMANFRIHTGNGWVCIEPADFQKVIIKNHTVNLALKFQLKSIFEFGGRKKDIKRAHLLK